MGKKWKECIIDMSKLVDYGVVYTPKELAKFLVQIVDEICITQNTMVNRVLDPACGDGQLLSEYRQLNKNVDLVGIDVDYKVIEHNRIGATSNMTYINNDAICPQSVKHETVKYWRNKLGNISLILANPPWSGEKVYDNEVLKKRGFELADGQYDSYILFLELTIKMLDKDGVMGFIIPDSLFSTQNFKIRKILCDYMHINVIARLGEKIFPGINRATTIIVCTKRKQNLEKTRCFRLNTKDRNDYLNKKADLYELYKEKSHYVYQKRFSENKQYVFDIDITEAEETLVEKISSVGMDMDSTFVFSRGVEISKSGSGVQCNYCNMFQGINKKHITIGRKKCIYCGRDILIESNKIRKVISDMSGNKNSKIYVGENIQRYYADGCKYIEKDISGIKYKNENLYLGGKIMIRKTGLGIKACIDYDGIYTSQTVYILKLKDECLQEPLEYYLALINSRVIYYFYIKKYGENEWKTHPYLTKNIIYSLPIKKYENNELCNQIVVFSKSLIKKYDYEKDIELEKLICKLYEISEKEEKLIYKTMNNLPNLRAVNMMKVKNKCIDT